MLLQDYEVKQFGLTQQHVLGVSLLFASLFFFELESYFGEHFWVTSFVPASLSLISFQFNPFMAFINCLHGNILTCPTQRTLSERPEINVERKVKQIFATPLVY